MERGTKRPQSGGGSRIGQKIWDINKRTLSLFRQSDETPRPDAIASAGEQAIYRGLPRASQPLCNLCAKINIDEMLKRRHNALLTEAQREYTNHQSSFEALQRSVRAGCKLCAIFQQAILDAYTTRCQWMEAQAIDYLLHDKFEVAETVQRREAGFKMTLTRLPGPGKRGEIPLAHGIYYQKFFYWIEAGEGSSQGDDDRYLNPDQVGEQVVYPWVSLSSISGGSPSVSGRPISSVPDLDLCSAWVKECSSTHLECGPVHASELPTRLIDVGDESSRDPKLVETQGRKGHYVTLSHCWGTARPLATTAASYNEHLKGIPFAHLPKTFQDAVTVVRDMGYQYLWIDSLCIKQGDQDDWQRECARMSETYEHSAFTIAPAAAPSSYSGFLAPRPAPALQPCILPGRTTWNEDDLVVSLSGLAPHVKQIRPKELDSPLASRGWVFQERLLSPRVIYFGSQQMYFECRTAEQYECCSHPLKLRSEQVKLPIGDRAYTKYQVRGLYLTWYEIVKEYSTCELTLGNDKLPALSGLAKRMAKKFNDTYLAGLWRNDLLSGLHWFVPLGQALKPRLQTYRAPSWSWASCDSQIAFRSLSRNRRGMGLISIEILDAGVASAGHDPFGEVTSGSLTVSGRIFHFTDVRYDSNGAAGDEHMQGDRLAVCQQSHRLATIYPDHRITAGTASSGSDPPMEMTCLHLTTGEVSGMAFFHGLAIERVSNAPDTFRRWGYVKSTSHHFRGWSADQHHPGWAAVKPRTLTLI